jgi:hypothetical protein
MAPLKNTKPSLQHKDSCRNLALDYFDTFSPVAKLSCFRIILAIAAHHDWEADTFNFNGTYLNSKLDKNEEIYMKPPPRYNSEREQVKCLHKFFYSLKQAGCKWYDTLCHMLTDLGLRVNDANPGSSLLTMAPIPQSLPSLSMTALSLEAQLMLSQTTSRNSTTTTPSRT